MRRLDVTEVHTGIVHKVNPIVRELLRSMYVNDLIGGEVNIQRVIALKMMLALLCIKAF